MQAEADLAAALFWELRSVMVAAARAAPPGAPAPARVAVGVITPYRQQALCLRDTFARMVGPEAAAEVGPPALLCKLLEQRSGVECVS